jgi:hypothetical protein
MRFATTKHMLMFVGRPIIYIYQEDNFQLNAAFLPLNSLTIV